MADIVANQWETIHSSPDVADTNPEDPAGLTLDTYVVDGKCRSVEIRLKYNTDATSSVDPVIIPWGRTNNGEWQNLKDIDDNINFTLATDETQDLEEGSYRYTLPTEIFLAGTHRLLTAVLTAFDVSVGTKTDSTLEIRMVIRS